MKNINITGTNVEITDAIKGHFEEKLQSLDKYLDPNDESIQCEARIGKIADNFSGEIFKAEISLHTAGKDYQAESVKEDMYNAIDDVKNLIIREVTSYKEKRRSLFKKGAKKAKNLLKGLNFRKNG